ncbi:Peroxisomal (S)-2-hydroxy-acid oxidase [Thalictrum thalictroides]|uniref:Peroxisomal (S)-2-hydroxy-acid oxidase n=1 Tax=Thalictrum thalictroides TaxID=46969 RepID=A0A7J6V515_THATH|nr:Peroxisomal (S)-2-hydroxy-acid oxidase [Thalictrum thalictroides]
MAIEPVNISDFQVLAKQALPKIRGLSASLVQRAERCGCEAIVLTADTPRFGRRETDIKNKNDYSSLPQFKNLEGIIPTEIVSEIEKGSKLEAFASAFYELEGHSMAKVYNKITNSDQEVLTAEDAVKSVEAEMIVSNHGGQQLDYVPATISILEEVAQAVEGRIPVLLDGGVTRGTYIFKALTSVENTTDCA